MLDLYSLFRAIECNSPRFKHYTMLGREIEPSEVVPITDLQPVLVTLDSERQFGDVMKDLSDLKMAGPLIQ